MVDIKIALNPSSVLSTIALALVVSAGHAAPVGPLTTFTAGTPAKASDVNANFTTIVNTVNANDTRLTTVETNKQNVVTGNCPAGSAIRVIAPNGTVTCQSTGGAIGFASVNSIVGVPLFQSTTLGVCIIFCSPLGRFSSSGNDILMAPIALPHGATITAMSFSCLCNNAAGSTATLFRDDTSVASVSITSLSANLQTQSTTTITAGTAVVDNQNFSYVVGFGVNGTAGSAIIPIRATVTYRLP